MDQTSILVLELLHYEQGITIRYSSTQGRFEILWANQPDVIAWSRDLTTALMEARQVLDGLRQSQFRESLFRHGRGYGRKFSETYPAELVQKANQNALQAMTP